MAFIRHFFGPARAREPMRRGQWDGALGATLHVTCTLACPRLAVSPPSLLGYSSRVPVGLRLGLPCLRWKRRSLRARIVIHTTILLVDLAAGLGPWYVSSVQPGAVSSARRRNNTERRPSEHNIVPLPRSGRVGISDGLRVIHGASQTCGTGRFGFTSRSPGLSFRAQREVFLQAPR